MTSSLTCLQNQKKSNTAKWVSQLLSAKSCISKALSFSRYASQSTSCLWFAGCSRRRLKTTRVSKLRQTSSCSRYRKSWRQRSGGQDSSSMTRRATSRTLSMITCKRLMTLQSMASIKHYFNRTTGVKQRMSLTRSTLNLKTVCPKISASLKISLQSRTCQCGKKQ